VSRVFQRSLKPVTLTPSETNEVHLGEKNIITAAKFFIAVEILKAKKVTG